MASASLDSRSGALRMEGLTKSYGDNLALDNVSLDVQAGEFVTLLGASGSGKTTTLRCVAGFLRPDSGRVVLNDRDIGDLAIHERNIGMVFQNYALFPHMTAAQNLAFPLEVRKVPRAEIAARVKEALALVHLGDLGGRYPRQLSGGQQQRVALARAIVFRPPLLLMDEPLGALDKNLREAMQLEITRISRELGVTVIYVTHDQEEALAMSDRIAVYHQGRIEQLGSGEELYERPATLYIAGFMGESTAFRGRLERDGGDFRIVTGRWRLPVTSEASERLGITSGQRAAVTVRPERLQLRAASSVGRPGTAEVRGVLQERIYLGSSRKFLVDLGDDEQVTIRVPAGGDVGSVAVGDEVIVSWELAHGVLVRDDPPSDGSGTAARASASRATAGAGIALGVPR